MSRLLFTFASLLGAIAIVWMGRTFIDTNLQALAVTVLIGAAYTIGFIELQLFRRATLSLSYALSQLSKTSSEDLTVLDQWLIKLHPSLQNSVRLRIEGERVGLPAPVITPYLVGLLVMLGLLGTFLGMVDTLQGAVAALQGTTELQAIRAGLAAPISGLGLAFGTSVAGVAASAMLGLASTLSRRDRIFATRILDAKISTELRQHSLVHNRQQTYKALQAQASALPEVAVSLQALAGQLELMGDNISNKLISNQESFHQSVNEVYSDLANSVEKSLKQSMVENNRLVAKSGRLVGESISPLMNELMGDINTQATKTHNQLTETAQKQLDNVTTALLDTFDKTSSSMMEQQLANDSNRLQLWSDSFTHTQTQAAHKLEETSKALTDELKQVTSSHQTAFNTVVQDFEGMSGKITEQWQLAGQNSLTQQQQIVKDSHSISEKLTDKISSLLKSTEALVDARIDSEQSWLKDHGQRMEDLTTVLKTELESLRAVEEQRSVDSVERLADLESAVAVHLVTLGKELEQPMTRLIQTASETPKAAAQVISQLQHEISNTIERDNSLLEERRSIMVQLNTLSQSFEQTSSAQQQAIQTLVDSSANILREAGSQFVGSAIEMSSLGEAFNHGIELFSESNTSLINNLNKIEESMDKSATRSDEQLGYYVAQAREIIDHSMLSQKEIFEELRRFSLQDDIISNDAVELAVEAS